MIEVRNLYTGNSRDEPLLEGFNYKFDPQIYGILGCSGCGKTTLLRTIAGLIPPLAGEVLIDNQIITKPGEVYMLHQNYTSFDWINCLDNVLISKKIKGNVSDNDIKNAEMILKDVGLGEHIGKYPRQLSGGMRQRLALARTLFMNPKYILMDEPLSALDSNTRAEMQNLILNIHKSIGNTIIMVTHSQEEADKMCDNIINL